MVSCSDDGAVFVWDAPTGGVVHRLEGHKTGVAYMSVTRAGQVGGCSPAWCSANML